MSLRRVVGAPFLRRGTETVTRAEFIYSLTADLGWFEPDTAEEALERGLEEDILSGDGDEVRAEFELDTVDIPEGWSPDADSFGSERGVFERAVERLVGAGYGKREAVAEINRHHAEMGDVGVEAVALVVAKSEGLHVADLADEALEEIRG